MIFEIRPKCKSRLLYLLVVCITSGLVQEQHVQKHRGVKIVGTCMSVIKSKTTGKWSEMKLERIPVCQAR